MTLTPALTAETAAPAPSLIDSLRRGESVALTEVYRQHATSLLALAYRLMGAVEDAEDIVQDLFVGLPEALGRYEERGRFGSWLRSVTVRLCLMRLRSSRRRPEIALEALGSDAGKTSPASDPDLWNALARLPGKQRGIVVLKVIEGYSHEEIAQLLGIRKGTSEVRLHRALARLKKLLEES